MSRFALLCPTCGTPERPRTQMPGWGFVQRYTCPACGETTLREELVPRKTLQPAFGGGPASLATSSIDRVARGTSSGTGSDGSGAYQIAPVVAVGTTGSTLVVCFAYSNGINGVNAMSWRGLNLTRQIARGSTTSLECWTLENASSGSGPLVIDDTPGNVLPWEFFCDEFTNAAVASVDKTAGALGTSTTPSSGNTPITSQTNEYLVGAISKPNSGITGTWDGGFAQGQTVINLTRSLEEGFLAVSTAAAYAAAKTGAANTAWIDVLITLREK